MKHGWPRKREPANHSDDWLMTYADMITLLLCFFAIFLSVSLPRKNVPHQMQLPQTVEQPTKAPDILEGNLPLYGAVRGDRPSTDSAVVVPVEPLATPPAPPPQNVALVETQIPIKPEPKIDTPPPEMATIVPTATPAQVPVQTPGQPAGKPSLPEIVDHLKSQGPAKIEQKGDRITTLEINSAAFFDSGSAALSNSGKSILRDVAGNLKSDQFKDYQITVEGHTDDAPISTPQFPSNWELSTARASAVVHFLLDENIPAQKLRAAGYADTFPVAPNRDAKGNAIPENQARNRRVVIKLEKIEKTE